MNLFLIFTIVSTIGLTSASNDSQWNDFKTNFNKTYKTNVEEQKRFRIFRDNCFMFEEHNRKYEHGDVSFKMGINRDADLTYDEITLRNIPTDV